MNKTKGFTLIELMIAVAIIGILVAVALPSYRNSVLRSNRADAHLSLARIATLQEQFFFRNNQYTGDFADIVNGVTSGQPIDSDEDNYSLVVTATGGGTGWTVTATAQGDQTDDADCNSLTMTNLGVKTALNSGGTANNTECWQ